MSSPTNSIPQIQPGSMKEIADWSGRKFGEFRGYRIIEKNIRILSHTGGYAIFLPGEVWRKFDHQVPVYVPDNEDFPCWIAGKGFTFLKVDTTPSELKGSGRDYISEDVNVALNKIESFVKKNYFENPQAYPDSEYFTYGSMIDHPNMRRPFRFRLGGDFHYQF